MDGVSVAVATLVYYGTIILCMVGLFFAVRATLLFFHRTNHKVMALFLVFITMPVMFIGFFAFISASAKLSKEKSLLYKEVAGMPSDERVDDFITYINKHGCVNNPQSWNQLRAVWIAVNKSPNVTTQKKHELKNFLMLQGLSIHHDDARVIDNYRR